MKFLLFQSSNTQRVTVQIKENGNLIQESSVLLSKEWRKSSTDDWIVGKGITIPARVLVTLGSILSCVNLSEVVELLRLNCELLKEEQSDE